MNKEQIKVWTILSTKPSKTLAQIREEIRLRETPEYLAEKERQRKQLREKSIAKAVITIEERNPHLSHAECVDKAIHWYDTKATKLI